MIEELQLHNKSAAVIFLQYQFSLLEGTIILPVSLIFHSYNKQFHLPAQEMFT